jgi:hypothetical protein
VAQCAISLAIAHSLLPQLLLVKASLPQFCAASSSFAAIVIAVVARPYPDASGANVNTLRERSGRNGKDCRWLQAFCYIANMRES